MAKSEWRLDLAVCISYCSITLYSQLQGSSHKFSMAPTIGECDCWHTVCVRVIRKGVRPRELALENFQSSRLSESVSVAF